ncbi:UPF0118 membrane protein [Arsenicicoccus piscis]|uniref:UPF0118 membrane protein n=1 Tax=Arsenicicoccus piscis TaxID=673954 RepID=A0ABQ6HWI1_9MICO|nr:UPF0118 membrane protein [Arsenicicoccus piscis]
MSGVDGEPVSKRRPIARGLSAVRAAARRRLDEPAPSQWADAYKEGVADGTRHTAEVASALLPGAPPDLDTAEAPSARGGVPLGVRVAAAWSWRLMLIGAAIYLVARGLAAVPIVSIPVVLALLLTAVLGPVARRLHHGVGIPHSLASFLALLLGIAVIGVIATFVVSQISDNAPRLAMQLTQFLDEASAWLRHGPLQVSDSQLQQTIDELSATVTKNQGVLVSGAMTTLSHVSETLAGTLLMLLATFFLLRDGQIIWGWVLSLLPRAYRSRLDRMGRVGWHMLGGYMRGVTIIALLHAVTVGIVLIVLHVPMALALAVLIFVASFVPMIGMTVAGTFCVIVSLIEHGPGAALVVAITIIVLIQLEAHLLQPLIMSRNVEVHPLGVAISVLAGAALWGIPGALFAVPLVAFANATVRASHLPAGESTGQGSRGAAAEVAAD